MSLAATARTRFPPTGLATAHTARLRARPLGRHRKTAGQIWHEAAPQALPARRSRFRLGAHGEPTQRPHTTARTEARSGRAQPSRPYPPPASSSECQSTDAGGSPPVGRTVLKQAVVIGVSALAPAAFGVVAGLLGQEGAVFGVEVNRALGVGVALGLIQDVHG